MSDRRLNREALVQLLFQWESQGLLQRKNIKVPDNISSMSDKNVLIDFLSWLYDKNLNKIDFELVHEWLVYLLENIVKIDELIDESCKKWRLARLDAIDRAILRLACFELAILSKLPHRVIINEAVEIAKRYGSEQSGAFVNGVLDGIKSNSSGDLLCK